MSGNNKQPSGKVPLPHPCRLLPADGMRQETCLERIERFPYQWATNALWNGETGSLWKNNEAGLTGYSHQLTLPFFTAIWKFGYLVSIFCRSSVHSQVVGQHSFPGAFPISAGNITSFTRIGISFILL